MQIPMQSREIEAALAEILARVGQVDAAHLSPAMRLQDDIGLNSLAMIDVAVAAEDRFGIMVPDDALERFETVGDIIAHITRANS